MQENIVRNGKIIGACEENVLIRYQLTVMVIMVHLNAFIGGVVFFSIIVAHLKWSKCQMYEWHNSDNEIFRIKEDAYAHVISKRNLSVSRICC